MSRIYSLSTVKVYDFEVQKSRQNDKDFLILVLYIKGMGNQSHNERSKLENNLERNEISSRERQIREDNITDDVMAVGGLIGVGALFGSYFCFLYPNATPVERQDALPFLTIMAVPLGGVLGAAVAGASYKTVLGISRIYNYFRKEKSK